MDAIVNSIVAELDEHIQTLQAAKAAILGASRNGKHSVHSVQSDKTERKRRKMSAAATKRIGDATRKRWAAKRKADRVVASK
jgi:hypothetical protein